MASKNNTSLTIEVLLTENNHYAKQFNTSPLMQLVKSDNMANKKIQERLLDCIQVISDYFQKTVMLRHIFSDDPKFSAITQEHLQEEFGHNLLLYADRKYRPAIWDPILEATAAWFTWKMFTLDNEEKTVLMHLILETSANIFFQEVHKIMPRDKEMNYFKLHSEADEKHEKMGIALLENLSAEKYQRLLKIQQQGWDMLNAAANRVATLTINA